MKVIFNKPHVVEHACALGLLAAAACESTSDVENGPALAPTPTAADAGSVGAHRIPVLPDRRVVMVGAGKPMTDDSDAMVAVLTPEGRPDTTFAPLGRVLHYRGGKADALWGVALSPGSKRLAVVGAQRTAAGDDDDAAILFAPVP